MAVKGVDKVVKNIRSIYDRKKAATYALCLETAQRAIDFFWQNQPPVPNSPGKYWHNITGQASARMHTEANITATFINWSMGHGVDYGVALELVDDGRREAIRPVIMHFLPGFKKDLEKIWGHAS